VTGSARSRHGAVRGEIEMMMTAKEMQRAFELDVVLGSRDIGTAWPVPYG
jgi:hypothetical protein